MWICSIEDNSWLVFIHHEVTNKLFIKFLKQLENIAKLFFPHLILQYSIPLYWVSFYTPLIWKNYNTRINPISSHTSIHQGSKSIINVVRWKMGYLSPTGSSSCPYLLLEHLSIINIHTTARTPVSNNIKGFLPSHVSAHLHTLLTSFEIDFPISPLGKLSL